MISSVTSSTTDWLQDQLITLWEGDEAVNVTTGEVVTCYSGLVGYLVPTGRSLGESQFKIDIKRRVIELIGKNQLPGIWVLKTRPLH